MSFERAADLKLSSAATVFAATPGSRSFCNAWAHLETRKTFVRSLLVEALEQASEVGDRNLTRPRSVRDRR
jgi:hypothetical protein